MTQPNGANFSAFDRGRGAPDLMVPEEIDAEWIQLFNLGVAYRGLRLMIYTPYFYFDENKGRGPKVLTRLEVSGTDSEGTVVDGKIVGAAILPLRRREAEEDGEICLEDVPHAILADASDTHSGQEISQFREERIYVPFSAQPPGSYLTVY